MKQYIALLLLAMISGSAFGTCLEVDGGPLKNGANLIKVRSEGYNQDLRSTMFYIYFLKSDGLRNQLIGDRVYASHGWSANGENRSSWSSYGSRRPNLRIDLRNQTLVDQLTGEQRKVVEIGESRCE